MDWVPGVIAILQKLRFKKKPSELSGFKIGSCAAPKYEFSSDA